MHPGGLNIKYQRISRIAGIEVLRDPDRVYTALQLNPLSCRSWCWDKGSGSPRKTTSTQPHTCGDQLCALEHFQFAPRLLQTQLMVLQESLTYLRLRNGTTLHLCGEKHFRGGSRKEVTH